MKLFSKSLCLAVVLFFTSFFTWGQLEFGGQLRPRFEFRNGFKEPIQNGQTPTGFVEQRSRIYVDYKKEKFRVHLNLQDVRLWGNTHQVYKSDESLFNFYEAYGEYYFTDKFTMKLGRMALVFNDERFFGGLNWASQGRSHDALTFRYSASNKLSFYFGGAYSNQGFEPTLLTQDFYGRANYKHMEFIWAHLGEDPKNRLSFLVQNEARQSPLDSSFNYKQTFGIAAKSDLDRFYINTVAFFQTGRTQIGNDIPFAFLLSAAATFKNDFSPVTLGIDFLSGTERGATASGSFQPLYGTNHAFYGHMDYFYVANFHGQNPIGTSGLVNAYLKFEKSLNPKHKVNLDVHEFLSPVNIYDVNDDVMSPHLGVEVDLFYEYHMTEEVTFTAGYSQMFASTTMDAVKNVNNSSGFNNWVYLMIDFTPVFFRSNP